MTDVAGPTNQLRNDEAVPGQTCPTPRSRQSTTSAPFAHGPQIVRATACRPGSSTLHGSVSSAAAGHWSCCAHACRTFSTDGCGIEYTPGKIIVVPPAKRDHAVVDAVHVHHRHRADAVAERGGARARDGRDGRDAVRCFGGEAVRHHRAVRQPGGVDAGRVDRRPLRHVVEHGEQEADVVDAAPLRGAAAVARVPHVQCDRRTARCRRGRPRGNLRDPPCRRGRANRGCRRHRRPRRAARVPPAAACSDRRAPARGPGSDGSDRRVAATR